MHVNNVKSHDKHVWLRQYVRGKSFTRLTWTTPWIRNLRRMHVKCTFQSRLCTLVTAWDTLLTAHSTLTTAYLREVREARSVYVCLTSCVRQARLSRFVHVRYNFYVWYVCLTLCLRRLLRFTFPIKRLKKYF